MGRTSRHLSLIHGENRPVATLVDSCVLIDMLIEDPMWADWSERAVGKAADEGSLIINPIVYAEISVNFRAVEDLDEAVPASVFLREPLPYEAGFLAGKAHEIYRRRGGTKRSPLPDFYIGAHASVRGYRLLTRDAKRYRTYFPVLEVLAPELG